MSHLYSSRWNPRYQEPEIPSADELADALERNEEERGDLVREILYLLDRTNSPEACQIFRADGTPNSQMLYLKRQVMFKFNRLLDSWNLYMDLTDINISSMILSNELGVEDASQQRHLHELYADKLRDIYVEAKREWTKEFRSHLTLVTLWRTLLSRSAGIA
ncbi:hypothetical protein M436DRAFT_81501 [Aureobasidium namibiae CBS 147.97]|uniref:Uncharacterized protein n=1 Tax=Aureobasidium namibiae CBS 147.97 TaxID=1043004 RepID=A0A074WWI8_9PEZI